MKEELIANIEADAPPESKTIKDIAFESLIPQGVEVPKPEEVFGLNGKPIFTKKSISTLIGRAKSGKTTVTAWVVSQLINQGLSVAWFDTEQGLYYGSRTQYWVLNIAGLEISDNLSFYDLKIHNAPTRAEIIEEILKDSNPDLVVIDGSRDLVFDINSPEESTIISGNFMRWAEIYDCHIMTVLHTNKGSDHARGHLGTELINKSESVIMVTLNKDENNRIECTPEFTRSEPFSPFAFDRDDRGIPHIIEDFESITVSNNIKKQPSLMPADPNLSGAHTEVINRMFANSEWLRFAQVRDQIRLYFETFGIKFGESKARMFLEYYVNEAMIIHDPSAKGHAKYRSGLVKNNTIQPSDEF